MLTRDRVGLRAVRLIRIGVCWQEMSVRSTIGTVFSGRLATHRRAIGGNFPGVLGVEWEEIRSKRKLGATRRGAQRKKQHATRVLLYAF
jgi:hypothetical protein